MIGLVFAGSAFAQDIPVDSMYLGQLPPGSDPVIFHLPVVPGSFAAERIAISADNKELYYTGIRNYYPTRGDTIKYFRYAETHWTGPFTLFDNFLAPALSSSGDTLFCQDNSSVYRSFYCEREGTGWSVPKRFLSGLNSAHYVQETGDGHFYVSSIPAQGLGGNDWCRLNFAAPDTAAICLGLPVSSGADNLDFFVARDESYMILAKNGLKISYHRTDGSWTNPKDLGAKINFGLGMWGPFVSADHKYLFYTTGNKPDYSDTYVYWVRADRLFDSLKFTNYLPYLKNPVAAQDAMVGRMFHYTLPDSTIVDDDGHHTLTYTARLSNGSPLPGWLAFDTITAAFSGIPDTIQTLNIKVKARDTAGAWVTATFRITVANNNSVGEGSDQGLRVFPNPARARLLVKVEHSAARTVVAHISSMEGNVILTTEFTGETSFDISGFRRGMYFLGVLMNDRPVIRKIVLH